MDERIKIVEYSPELAAAVADMWNHSREGWGGGSSIMTAEQVRRREEQSGNLNLYLAVEGEKVVGYCGLSEYREDEGALYIPLLNVRTDYHGKKIGKLLVLEALKRTVELGWPRLDLYTWPGNTKAVPLYKKCGFFWEDRDDVTHLMNFIPTVLQTEQVQDFFAQTDWYSASTRLIEVQPDGRQENGFDFFTYSWEHEGKQLNMEFERRGRGLRLIETDEYVVAARLKQAECITGRSYQIEYDVFNKTAQPLEIKIEGESDKNIRFDFSTYHQVEREKKIVGDFFVGALTEEQSEWRTHPGVQAQVWINGKRTTFKLGILPKLPAKMAAHLPDEQCYLHKKEFFYLNLENNVDQQVEFAFDWPETSWISFLEPTIQITLEAKAKQALAIPYTLSQYGFYQTTLQITAKIESGETLSFEKQFGLSFPGMEAVHAGESEEYWHICQGLYEVKLSKFNNDIVPHKAYTDNNQVFWRAPQLGKPFSLEFSKKRPTQVYFEQQAGVVALLAVYHSDAFPGLELKRQVKLMSNGCIEQQYSIRNTANTPSAADVTLNEIVYYELTGSTIPYDQGILRVRLEDGGEYSDWSADLVTENWLFANDPQASRGVCWSPQHKLTFNSWFFTLEYELGVIEATTEVFLEPTYICLDTFRNYEDLQRFAQQRYEIDSLTSTTMNQSGQRGYEFSSVELSVNKHNPFIKQEAEIELKLRKQSTFAGQLSVKSKYGSKEFAQHVDAAADINRVACQWAAHAGQVIDVIEARAQTLTQTRQLDSLVFFPGNKPVQQHVIDDGEQQIYILQNGPLQAKVAPHYYPALYSLTHVDAQGHGVEWLDTAFPQAKAKAWWNPWGGGIYSKPSKMSLHSLLKEKGTIAFASLQDQFGNEWQGIKLRVEVAEHKGFKGLAWNQYYLTMSGLPLLGFVTEIEQYTQTYWPKQEWVTSSFFRLDPDLPLLMQTDKGGAQVQEYQIGQSEIEIFTQDSVYLQQQRTADQLQVITSKPHKLSYLYSNKEACQTAALYDVQAKHGQTVFLPPTFYVFPQERIRESALTDLKRIRFSTL